MMVQSGWILAGFEDRCLFGDMIEEGHTVRWNEDVEAWEHMTCPTNEGNEK